MFSILPKKNIGALLGCLLLVVGCSAQETAREVTPPKIMVEVVAPIRQDMESVLRYPCQIRPATQVYVTSKIGGKVAAVYHDIADKVTVGDPLFALDTTDIDNNIRTLQAQIHTAEAAVRSAETGVALATGSQLQSQINQASGAVLQASSGVEQARIACLQSELGVSNANQALEQAQLTYKDLERDLQNSQKLLAVGEVTRRQLEQLELALEQMHLRLQQAELGQSQALLNHELAKTMLEQAESSQRLAESSLALVSNQVPLEAKQRAEDTLNQATAQRDALLTQLITAETALAEAVVRAPISGTITSRQVEVGAMIGTSTMAFTLMDIETVYASINISESHLNKVQVGMEMKVRIAAVREEDYWGKIEVIGIAAAPGAAVFEVRLALPNAEGAIKPGMYAEVNLVALREEGVLVLPRGAILADSNSHYIYVVENDVAYRREVRLGIEVGNMVSILSGIQSAEAVVVKGNKGLSHGAAVTMVNTLS